MATQARGTVSSVVEWGLCGSSCTYAWLWRQHKVGGALWLTTPTSVWIVTVLVCPTVIAGSCSLQTTSRSRLRCLDSDSEEAGRILRVCTREYACTLVGYSGYSHMNVYTYWQDTLSMHTDTLGVI